MISPTRSNHHLHRPNDRAIKMRQATLQDIGTAEPGSGTAYKGLVDERRRMFAKRLAEVQRGDVPIRNTTITCQEPYKTGDGDCFHQPRRAGSMRAFELPSRGIGT